MKPYIQMDHSGIQEDFSLPNMILMPELMYTNEEQDELDEYKLLAQYALADETYLPKALKPVPVMLPTDEAVEEDNKDLQSNHSSIPKDDKFLRDIESDVEPEI